MMRLISSGVGMSTPTLSLRLPRLSMPIETSLATFWATLPRRCASLSSDLRLVSTFFASGRDMFANRSSRNLLMRGVVSLASLLPADAAG